MGNCWANIWHRRRIRRRIVLILIGLDNAGKTQTVNKLAGEKDDSVLPTVGFKAVNLVHKDTPVTVYDLGGGPHFRQIWPQYYSEVHGVIFVIDSSDYSRLEECKNVLEEVLSHDKISGKPVLILANKQDKQGAMDDIDIVEKLNIEPLVNRFRCPTLVESYTANALPTKISQKRKLDPGLRKGYQWLLNYIVHRYGDINLRVQTDIHADLERRKHTSIQNASRASQTFTAQSNDDIITQTGFENPNYKSLARNSVPVTEQARIQALEQGVIIVKPQTHNAPHSLDTTVTIESVEDISDNTSCAKPKLSPLFGRASDHGSTSGNGTGRIELETRNEIRKLSPIVHNKNASAGTRNLEKIHFKSRPHSSPTAKNRKLKNKVADNSENIITSNLDATFTDVYLGDGNKNAVEKCVYERAISEKKISIKHKALTLSERSVPLNKVATSDIMLGVNNVSYTLPGERPASASQLVRKQLEIYANPGHKRRLSLRYGQRNKTSPESLGLFHFDPNAKSARQMDHGDFESAMKMNRLQHGDVSL